jgi:hypothetical protein
MKTFLVEERDCVSYPGHCYHCGKPFRLWCAKGCTNEAFHTFARSACCDTCAHMFKVFCGSQDKFEDLRRRAEIAFKDGDDSKVEKLNRNAERVRIQVAELRLAFGKRTGGRTFERSKHRPAHLPEQPQLLPA